MGAQIKRLKEIRDSQPWPDEIVKKLNEEIALLTTMAAVYGATHD